MEQGLKVSEENFSYPMPSQPSSLVDQDHKCRGCETAIWQGLYLLFCNANFCHFDNSYYCNDCYSFERVPIYHKALENFDLKGYGVSKENKRKADLLRDRPIITIENNHRIVAENERLFRFLVLRRELHLMYDLICDPRKV
jgi:hypothetical protein